MPVLSALVASVRLVPTSDDGAPNAVESGGLSGGGPSIGRRDDLVGGGVEASGIEGTKVLGGAMVSRVVQVAISNPLYCDAIAGRCLRYCRAFEGSGASVLVFVGRLSVYVWMK